MSGARRRTPETEPALSKGRRLRRNRAIKLRTARAVAHCPVVELDEDVRISPELYGRFCAGLSGVAKTLLPGYEITVQIRRLPPEHFCNAGCVGCSHCTTLNGRNGEATNSDDVKGVKKVKLPKNVRKVLNKEGAVIGNKLKNMALETVHKALDNASAGAAVSGSGAYRVQTRNRSRSMITGRGAYRGAGAYRGMGAYNQLFPDDTMDLPMKIATPNNETGIISIAKREYLFDVFSPATPANFTCSKFQVNPGLGGLSPFLAQIAGNYEKFRYRRLVFEFHPVVTDSSSTGQMGVVLLAFNSNAGAASFATKQAMAEYDGSLTMRVCDPGTLGAECDPRKGASNWLFIRTGGVPSGQDVKSYDFGSFQVATSGVSATAFPAGTQLGEIWVDYEVEMAGPKLYDALGFSNLTDQFYGTVGCSLLLPLGTAPLKSGLNSLGGVLAKTGGSVYTFPDNFQGWVAVSYSGSAATVAGPTITPVGNVNSFNCVQAPAGLNSNTLTVATGTQFNVTAYYYVQFASTSGGNQLSFTLGTFTTATIAQLTIAQFNSQGGPAVGASSNYVPV